MSKIEQIQQLNQEYSNLCALYGDLMLKQNQLTAEINQVLNNINNLKLKQQILLQNKNDTESHNEQKTTDPLKAS